LIVEDKTSKLAQDILLEALFVPFSRPALLAQACEAERSKLYFDETTLQESAEIRL
jgi:hypothetical protein